MGTEAGAGGCASNGTGAGDGNVGSIDGGGLMDKRGTAADALEPAAAAATMVHHL